MSNSKLSLYLQKLRFDERLRGTFVAKYLSNVRLIILMIICLFIAGVLSFISLPRQLNPDVDLSIVNVVTVLPGAAPLDVENLVTKKIEKEISSISNIDTITSQSNDSVSVITVQFLSGKDSDKALEEVRQKVDQVNDLPDTAQTPSVQKLDFNDQPVWQVALTGDTDRISLSKVAEHIQEKAEAVNGVRKVDISGNDEDEIVIELDKKALRELSVSSAQIAQNLQMNDVSFPAGKLTVNDTQYTLTVDNELQSVEQLRQTPLNLSGKTVQLADIANIYIRSKENNSQTFIRQNGKRLAAVELSVFKTDDESIDGAYQKAKKVIDETLRSYPKVQILDVQNAAKETNQSFSDLQEAFFTAIFLVLLALTIFLGFKQAIIASISLPLTLMCSFIIMGMTGIALSFLAVFSLLLAISLIGDDAVVIVQSYKQYHKKFPPLEAALLVWRDFFLQTWTGTFSVVWSFVPLLLASGIIGKFIRPIPIVVSATLLSSTAISTFINLPLNIVFAAWNIPKRVRVLFLGITTLISIGVVFAVIHGSPLAMIALLIYVLLIFFAFKNRVFLGNTLSHAWQSGLDKLPRVKRFLDASAESGSLINIEPVSNRYRSIVESIIEHKSRRIMVYGVLGLLIFASVFVFATGLLKSEFFPKTDENTFTVSVEGPSGWTTEKTASVMEIAENIVDEIPEVKYSYVQLGSGGASGFSAGASGTNVGSVVAVLKDKDERQRPSTVITEDVRKKLTEHNEATFTVQEASGGPPAGSDFQANIKGDDLDTLEEISKQFMTTLSEINGVTNIQTSLKLSAGQIHVDLIPAELTKRNLSAVQVGDWLRTAVSGKESGSIVIDDNDTDIIIDIPKENQNLSELQNLVLPSQMGAYTLNDIAHFSLEKSPSTIAREDGKRVVRVTASAAKGQTGPEILKAFNQKIKSYEIPEGYTWDVGGANEENQKSVNSILQAMVISFVLILVTMVLLLGSFRQSFMILSMIPFAIAWVFVVFTLFGIPLSFPALIGVLALFGIVVNNAIMLMDKINKNIKEGFPLYKGLADAGAQRIEPIFLTAIVGISGLLPISLSDPLWRGLGGAIIAGLSISGILILFVIPTLYVDVFGKEILKRENTK